MFEAFYGSSLQHPLLLWSIPIGYLFVRWRVLFSLRSPSFLSHFLRLVVLGTILDASLTSDPILRFVGFGPALSQALAIGFVIAGDFRVLYLLVRLRGNRPHLIGISFGLSLIVPLLQALLTQIAPSAFADIRHTFLVYELLFIGLLLVIQWRFGTEPLNPQSRLAREVGFFALGYYCLWALSDGFILMGADSGYLLRVVPNLLYYGAFAPFVDARATALGVWNEKPGRGFSALALLLALSALGCEHQAERAPCPESANDTSASKGAQPERKVTFVPDMAGASRATTVSELKAKLGPGERVDTEDPYYGKKKAFLGWPVARVLGLGFEEKRRDLRSSEIVFEATDGYQVRLPMRKLVEDGAYLVHADADLGALAPIGPRKSDPGPLYLVWKGDRQTDLTSHPRPFSVNRISFGQDSSESFGPPGGFSKGAPESRGNELFLQRCVRCHALNQKGGRVGPDLNVPQNILAYRSEADVRSYIRDPRTFRYGAMPPHLDLSEEQMDALIAFLKAMARYQTDPGSGEAE